MVSISNLRLLGNEKPPVEKRDHNFPGTFKVHRNSSATSWLSAEKGPEIADLRETHLDAVGHRPGVFTAD